ncbi:MAG: hypothetical protein ABIK28_14935, partial [Planctomycetota bacterium]
QVHTDFEHKERQSRTDTDTGNFYEPLHGGRCSESVDAQPGTNAWHQYKILIFGTLNRYGPQVKIFLLLDHLFRMA